MTFFSSAAGRLYLYLYVIVCIAWKLLSVFACMCYGLLFAQVYVRICIVVAADATAAAKDVCRCAWTFHKQRPTHYKAYSYVHMERVGHKSIQYTQYMVCTLLYVYLYFPGAAIARCILKLTII